MKVTKNVSQAEIEEMLWSGIPREHHGKRLHCLEELKDIFPRDEHYEEIHAIKTEMGINIYVRPYRGGKRTGKNILDQYVAYDCPHCNRIVVGPPVIQEISHPKSYAENCSYCGYRIKRLAA